MIPNLTILIAAYIVFRCIEILCANASRFQSAIARSLMNVVALLLIVIAGWISYETVLAGAHAQNQMESFGGLLR